MTTEHEASRTLVKSPPELWAECSDATSLARHLDQFGEIRITRLEPETAVAWEGEEVSGTVRLEPSGWGTRVIMTARRETIDVEEQSIQPEPASPPEQTPAEEPAPPEDAVPPEEPAPEEEPTPEPEPHPQLGPPAPAAAEPPRLGLLARLRRRFRGEPPSPAPVSHVSLATAPKPPEPPEPLEPPEPPEPPRPPELSEPPEPEEPPAPPEPVLAVAVAAPPTTEAALTAALDSLGQAHHRPFSRP